MKRTIALALFSALFMGTLGCKKEKPTQITSIKYVCRVAQIGVFKRQKNPKLYPITARSREAAQEEASEKYMQDYPDAKNTQAVCHDCDIVKDRDGRKICDQLVTIEESAVGGCSVFAVGN